MSLVSSPLPKSRHLNKISKKQQQHKKNGNEICSSSRILITVNVNGSSGPIWLLVNEEELVQDVNGRSGPIRLLVNEEELVQDVIRSVLKNYAREGRLLVFGHESAEFYLYHASIGGALKSSEAIGYRGSRNFLMSKKPAMGQWIDDSSRKGNWKTWLNKSLNFTISSH